MGAIVVWAPDRLHRSPRELEDFVEVVNQHHVQVVTVQAGEWDLSTADGRAMARLLGTIARMESEKKAARVQRAWLSEGKSGKPNMGCPRWGFRERPGHPRPAGGPDP